MHTNIEIDLNGAELAGLRYLLNEHREATQGLSTAVSDILVREKVQRAHSWTLKGGKMLVVINVEEGDPPETEADLEAELDADGPIEEAAEADLDEPAPAE